MLLWHPGLFLNCSETVFEGGTTTNQHTQLNSQLLIGWFHRQLSEQSKISEKHPNSALADRFGSKSNAKVKAETIAKKHGLVKDGDQDLSKRFTKDKKTGLY